MDHRTYRKRGIPIMKTPSLLSFEAVVGQSDPDIYDIQSSAPGPEGSLPLTGDMLRESPSGETSSACHRTWAWGGVHGR